MEDDEDRQSDISEDMEPVSQAQEEGLEVSKARLPLAQSSQGKDMEQDDVEVEEEDEEEGETFALVANKQLPAKVALASWCPTMDLLAVFTVDKRLSIHRLNWEPLW